MKEIYLDYASTTPTDPEVVKAMEPYFYEKFGNAVSPHSFGREAQKAVEDSRETLAGFLRAKTDEIVFTSGGTESNNQAVLGVARGLKDKGNHIIVSKLEHYSVLKSAEYLAKDGFRVTYLGVDKYGVVDCEDVKKAITDKTILISVMHASNEIGTIQPISDISKIAKEKDVLFHVDAVQTVGHLPVNVDDLGVDLLSLSAHKFYGPKGIGALYIRKGVKVPGLIIGGDQEKARRASTHNVPGIVGLAKAIDLCKQRMQKEAKDQVEIQKYVVEQITKQIEGVVFNGHPVQRLPNNLHFSFDKVQGEALLMSLDMIGIAVSMGSACSSGALEPSHVLRAIGLADDLAYGSLRVTTGRWTIREHIDYLLKELPGIINRLRV